MTAVNKQAGRCLYVCTTCRKGEGKILLAHIQEQAQARGDMPPVVAHECLWACNMGCNVMLTDPRRYGYLMGGFRSDFPASAQAIVDFVVAHDTTQDGQVDFKDWPAGVKGHFIARIPSANEDNNA